MENLPIDAISLPSRIFYSATEEKIYVGTPGDYKEVKGGIPELTGDVVSDTNGVTEIEKISNASESGKTKAVTVLSDGTVEGEEIGELWVYDDTMSAYSLSDLQTNYPTSAGRFQGFEVRCRLLTPPTTYRKESTDDSQWIKIEATNVT